MPPHPMMPMAALYGMPGHPYGPAMSMPGGGEGRKANRSTHLYTSGGYSVPQSVISGATTVRRARSVAEMSGHGGSPGGPGHHGSLGGHGQGGGQVGQIASKSRPFSDILHFQVEPKSLHASMASLAQSHHQHHGPPMPHHHRMVLGENG